MIGDSLARWPGEWRVLDARLATNRYTPCWKPWLTSSGGEAFLREIGHCRKYEFLNPSWVVPLQMLEEGLGFQPVVHLQQLPEFLPDFGIWVGPGSPPRPPRQLARYPAQWRLLLGVHARHGGRNLLIPFHLHQCKQPPYLLSVTNPPPFL